MDLRAYWELMNDPDLDWRYLSCAPMRAGDMMQYFLKYGNLETMRAFKVWLFSEGGGRLRLKSAGNATIEGQASRNHMMRSFAKQGVSQEAMNFWMGQWSN